MDSMTTQVLVVDDDPSVRRMVSTFLELEGYLASEAADGSAALLQAEESPPHAVLLDVMMPGMDGFAVCKKLRENARTQESVIIFLSVLDKADSKVEGLQVGADDFLTKPFDPSELMARLKAHLRRAAAQREKEKMLERFADKLAVMNRRLQEEAATDSLTGLYNRRQFQKRFEDEMERACRYKHALSFLFLDLDWFKSINDRFGHPFGDQVLREFGKLLRSHVRGIDLIGRFGGEEFGLLFPETSFDSTMVVAERLRNSQESFSLPPLPQGIPTFSGGLATFPFHGNTAQELYIKADEALYEAKTRGKNRIVGAF